ncbi:hypothetical protein ML462_01135 [Gramella lutea]|uniref:Uncharacterized protein n=1 Tax=Christiangramia lutea TaxID=1607951 RepID=A0A9X1V004_9FLAO|nr:hypothetical protein [Christiangramia lutea]MCH4821762.1 hypothetical protein [Christiangramia lutea]
MMKYDLVEIIRDTKPIPYRFKEESENIAQTFYSFKPFFAENVSLRQTYSIEAIPEIEADDTSKILIWDWRWVEQIQRIMKNFFTDKDGSLFISHLSNLMIAERIFEERDLKLGKSFLHGHPYDLMSISEFDEQICTSEWPDKDFTHETSRKVLYIAFYHEIAHLLLDNKEEYIINERFLIKDKIENLIKNEPSFEEEWEKLSKGCIDVSLKGYIQNDSFLDEIVCDSYAFDIFKKAILQDLNRKGSKAENWFYSFFMYSSIIDSVEETRRTISERQIEYQLDFKRNLAERTLRHKIAIWLFFGDILKSYGTDKKLINSKVIEDFYHGVTKIEDVVFTGRFFLLTTIHQLQSPKNRQVWEYLADRRCPNDDANLETKIWKEYSTLLNWSTS